MSNMNFVFLNFETIMLGIELTAYIPVPMITKSGLKLRIVTGTRNVVTNAYIAGEIIGNFLIGTRRSLGGSSERSAGLSWNLNVCLDLIANRVIWCPLSAKFLMVSS